jgi:hypothetical protein
MQEKEKRRKTFLEFFFRSAQCRLPRHQFKELTLDAQRRSRSYMKDTMTIDDDDPLSKDEAAVILGPMLADLVDKHGIDKARIIFKEAVRRAGFDPECADIQYAKPVLS